MVSCDPWDYLDSPAVKACLWTSEIQRTRPFQLSSVSQQLATWIESFFYFLVSFNVTVCGPSSSCWFQFSLLWSLGLFGFPSSYSMFMNIRNPAHSAISTLFCLTTTGHLGRIFLLSSYGYQFVSSWRIVGLRFQGGGSCSLKNLYYTLFVC